MKDTAQFVLIICLFVYVIFLQQCNKSGLVQEQNRSQQDTIIRMDTTPPSPIIVYMPKQDIPPPQIIYVDREGQEVAINNIDTTKHHAVQLYQDSLNDENVTIYYKALTDGELLQNALSYKLKVPLQITKTVEVFKPVPTPVNAFYFNVGVGSDFKGNQSLTIGAQFVSAKNWALGYDYDIFQQTHQIKLGIKLFQLKTKVQ